MEIRPRIIGAFIVIFLAFLGGNMAISKISAVFNRGAFQNQELTTVSPYIFSKLIKGEDVILLDVRNKEYYQSAHIKGAKNLDLDLFTDLSDSVEYIDPTKTYLIYTEYGWSNSNAAENMKELGFVKLVELDGGYRAWISAGYSVEK